MREDYFTNTPEDAGRYEEMRAETDAAADRPTLAEVDGDDGMSWPKAFDAWDAHEMDEAQQRLDSAHASGEYCIEWVGVDLAPDGPDKVYACVECGRTHRQCDTR
jgi:hypothetical protein